MNIVIYSAAIAFMATFLVFVFLHLIYKMKVSEEDGALCVERISEGETIGSKISYARPIIQVFLSIFLFLSYVCYGWHWNVSAGIHITSSIFVAKLILACLIFMHVLYFLYLYVISFFYLAFITDKSLYIIRVLPLKLCSKYEIGKVDKIDSPLSLYGIFNYYPLFIYYNGEKKPKKIYGLSILMPKILFHNEYKGEIPPGLSGLVDRRE